MSRWRHKKENDPPSPAIGVEEERIRTALGKLGEITAKEVMTPRVDVVALEAPVGAEAVAEAVRQSGHSRFPIYDGDLDTLLGVLFVKDLFRMAEWPGNITPDAIARRLRSPFLVPESQEVLELIALMRQGRHAFAVVVDEYGGVEGVLTIKDLVSELVGDLRDEFDRPAEAFVTSIDATRWLVDGATSVEDVRTEIGVDVPDGDYVTIAGFLFERFGRIPDEGDTLEWKGWEFRVTQMDRRRISQVVVRAPAARLDGPPAEGGTGK